MRYVADITFTRHFDKDGYEHVTMSIKIGALRVSFGLSPALQLAMVQGIVGAQRDVSVPLNDGTPHLTLPKGMRLLTAETLKVKKVET